MDEVSALALLRSSAENERRGDAAEALGDAQSGDSFDALVNALAERSPLVRLGAERGLVRRREQGASDALVRCVEHADAELAARLARVLATRTDARADQWTGAAIAEGTQLASIVKGLADRRDARAVELLGAVWTRHERARPDVVYALRGADLRPIEAEILRGLERDFYSDREPRPYQELQLAAGVLAARADALCRCRALLAPVAPLHAFEVERAKAILHCVEERWSELSERRLAGSCVAAPEPAWRAVLEPLVFSSAEEVAESARPLVRALDWFDGHEPFERVLPVELPECDEPDAAPFPLVVLGFEVGLRVSQASAEESLDRLGLAIPEGPRLGLFSHQYGGLACLQSRLLGYAVRLPANEASRLAPLFAAWYGTSGEAMTEPDRLEWAQILGPAFEPIEAGAEGRLASAPRARLDAFEGRPVLELCARAQPWRAIGWGGGGFDVVDGPSFGDAHVAVLRSIGACLGDWPSAFLLWSSSD